MFSICLSIFDKKDAIFCCSGRLVMKTINEYIFFFDRFGIPVEFIVPLSFLKLL
jgi:hypothetical protein